MKNSIKSKIKNFYISGKSISGHQRIQKSPFGDLYSNIYPETWVNSIETASCERIALDFYLEEVLQVFLLDITSIFQISKEQYKVIFDSPFGTLESSLIVEFNVLEYYEEN